MCRKIGRNWEGQCAWVSGEAEEVETIRGRGEVQIIRCIFEINNPRDIDKLDIYC